MSANYDPRAVLRREYVQGIAAIRSEVQRISRGLSLDPGVSSEAVTSWRNAVLAACSTLLAQLEG